MHSFFIHATLIDTMHCSGCACRLVDDLHGVELQLADNACGKPVVISGAMDAWPAMSKWKDLQYLRDQCGARTVPIEVQNAAQIRRLMPMLFERMLMRAR